MKKWIWPLAFFVLAFDLAFSQNVDSQTINNLVAFAKLYGYVRFFHPADEASRIDWEKFAVYGVGIVKDAKDRDELQKKLAQLFYPLAPTLQIYKKGETPEPIKHPEAAAGLYPVYWQHYGVGLNKHYLYRSVRIGRIVPEESLDGRMEMSFSDNKFKKKKFKINAMIKADVQGKKNYGNLFINVSGFKMETVLEKNFHDHPIRENQWQMYSLTGTFPDTFSFFSIGVELEGIGKLWVDDLEFSISEDGENWENVSPENSGFESELKAGDAEGWTCAESGYIFETTDQEKFTGNRSLLIQNVKDWLPGTLFEKRLKPGTVVQKSLGSDLFCQLPLALWADDDISIGGRSRYPLAELQAELEKIDLKTCTADNENVRFANIVIAWNIFRHFYPYFDVVKADWENALPETLTDLLDAESSGDFLGSLREMLAKLEDGHALVFPASETPQGGLPIRVEYIEDNLVVTAIEGEPPFMKGDIIKSIDGTKAMELLREREKYVSGSPQLKRCRALTQFGGGPLGSKAKLELIRAGRLVVVETERKKETRNFFFNKISEFDFPDITELEEGIFYVNVTTTDKKDFTGKLNELAKAKGIILDERWDGKIDMNLDMFQPEMDLFPHLIDEKIDSAWWNIPEIIYPDYQDVTYHPSNWSIYPKAPRIKAKIVAVTIPEVVSYGETYMGIYEHYKLGETVGEATAGCNGNVNPFQLMGGFEVWWTGMKVLKHDGSQHHLVGIKPTYPVRKTIEAVKQGRDEFLEKAIAVVKSKTNGDELP